MTARESSGGPALRQLPGVEDVVRLCQEVVGASGVTPESNFFDVGGDSLTAARMAVLLEEQWDASVDVFTLIAAEDLREIHEELVRSITERSRRATVPARPSGPVLPSWNQAVRLQMDAEAAEQHSQRYAHNMVLAFRAAGELDPDRLKRALGAVAARHEPLRSAFTASGEVRVLGEPRVALQVCDIDDCADELVRRRLEEHAAVPFDLTAGPPWNVLVLRHHDSCALVLVCLDHLLIDGEGIDILLRDLAQAYDTEGPLDPLFPGYYDWAHWQRTVQTPSALAESEHLVHDANPGHGILPELRLDIEGDQGPSELGLAQRLLPEPLIANLTEIAGRQHCTLFQALFLAFGLTVDAIRLPGPFGIVTPMANRARPETASMLGWVSNMAFIPLDLDWSAGFTVGLSRVSAAFAQASVTSTIPVRVIQEHFWEAVAPIVRAPGLFMDFRREERTDRQARGGQWRYFRIEAPTFLLPGLSLWVRQDVSGRTEGTLGYDRGKIIPEQADRILAALESLLGYAVACPDQPLRKQRARLAASVRHPGTPPASPGEP